MYKIMIEGFKTKAQAEAFIKWYEGQGEQDACIWFECRKQEGKLDVDSMMVNYRKTYPLNWDNHILNMVVNPQ